MAFSNFDELISRVGQHAKRRVVVAAAQDAHALEAVFLAHARGDIDYLLTGDRHEILKIAASLGYGDLDDSAIIDAKTDEESAKLAVAAIRDGRGDFLMKGHLNTSELMHEVVDSQRGIRAGGVMSHVAILQVPAYHKLLGVTDGGMIINPDLEQKAAMIENAVNFFHSIGYERPKVAVLAAVETVTDKMIETVHAEKLKEMWLQGRFGECELDGPLSFDLAVSRQSAQIKEIDSPLAEDVDIMLVPSIACGNILCKSLIYLGGAVLAGCIVGAKAPIVLTSRGSSAQEKYLSLLIAAASCR